MLPSFDTLKTARTETEIERAFERLVNIADARFMREPITQAQYDAWYQTATSIINERILDEFRPTQPIQSYSDFIDLDA